MRLIPRDTSGASPTSSELLIEVMIAAVCAALVMLALFAFLDSATRFSASDQERNISLVEQTAALHRMTQELGEPYQLNGPDTVGSSNYIDVRASEGGRQSWPAGRFAQRSVA
jgi:hypothetical protein